MFLKNELSPFYMASQRAISAAALLLIFSIPGNASAQWVASPSLGLGFEYDDNASLGRVSLEETSTDGILIEAALALVYDSPLVDLSITPRVLSSNYEISNLDSDDYFIDIDYDYAGQRTEFRVRVKFSDQSTRSAERSDVDFDVDDPIDIDSDDSAQLLTTEKRQRIRLNPDWLYRTGERTAFRLGVDHIDVSYEEGSIAPFTDYEESSGQASFEYQRTERNALTLGGYYRENSFESSTSDISGSGILAGSRWSLSNATRVLLNIGVDSTEDESGDSQTTTVGQLSVIRKQETSSIRATYRRNLTGSGAGEMSVRDTVDLSFTRDVSERFSISAGARAYHANPLDSESTSIDQRDWLQFRALFAWKLSQKFGFEIDYSYTNIDRDFLPSDEESNVINVWLRYQPRR